MELSELLRSVARMLPLDPDSEPDVLLHPEGEGTSSGLGSFRLREGTHVTGITEDSRLVRPGDLFVAVPGARNDGMLFAADAIARGAVAVVGARGSRERLGGRNDPPSSVPVVEVDNPRRALSALSARFFGEPTRSLTTIGVTGTNGKTTTAHMIAHLLGAEQTALISTVSNVKAERPGLTTPSSVEVQRTARHAVDHGCRALVIEASSIGLAMDRLTDVRFDVAVWIGVTAEHLGFHRTMRRYVEAKLNLVRSIGSDGICVVRGDDRLVALVERNCRGNMVRFGIHGAETVHARDLDESLLETQFTLCVASSRALVRLPLPGEYNVINALAAAAAVHGLGMNVEAIAERMGRFRPVDGRFEAYRSPSGALAVVDFAHTPDALARVLRHLRSHAPSRASRLIVVFGCTGDADREKRFQMGRTVGSLADLAVITLDNPKLAVPEAIATDVAAGVREAGGQWRSVSMRSEAISNALVVANEHDVVLVAGKGHETHQIVGDRLEPHSDRLELLGAGCVPVTGTQPRRR